MGYFGSLMPSIAQTIRLKNENISKMIEWYKLILLREEQYYKRAFIASHFYHSAIFRDDIEKFINHFIVLDALLGNRNYVEQSIIDNIRKIIEDDDISEKVKLLYNLRSELIHGGSSSIDNWKYYDHYFYKYDTSPIDDIEHISSVCLANYPNKIKNV